MASIIGVAILAVLVAPSSQTSNVLTAGGSAFSSIIKAAVSPIGGSSIGVGSICGGLPCPTGF